VSETEYLAEPAEMAAAKREAQDHVLALLAQGDSITRAMKEVGRQVQTFHAWMNEPWFKVAANAIRSK